jgi:hypothetical protein
MLPYLTFLLGLAIGLLPILRRSLESIRWAVLSRWATKRGIHSKELTEDEIIGRMKEKPKAQAPLLRRAK